MSMTESCKTCRFWSAADPGDVSRLALDGERFGDCRRYPLHKETVGIFFVRFAWSRPDAWCGEYRAAAEAREFSIPLLGPKQDFIEVHGAMPSEIRKP